MWVRQAGRGRGGEAALLCKTFRAGQTGPPPLPSPPPWGSGCAPEHPKCGYFCASWRLAGPLSEPRIPGASWNLSVNVEMERRKEKHAFLFVSAELVCVWGGGEKQGRAHGGSSVRGGHTGSFIPGFNMGRGVWGGAVGSRDDFRKAEHASARMHTPLHPSSSSSSLLLCCAARAASG